MWYLIFAIFTIFVNFNLIDIQHARATSEFLPFSQFVKSQYITIIPNNTVRVNYVPKNNGSPRIGSDKAISPKYKNEAMMEFEVFFDKDFEWVRGGKMHGFISGSPKTVATGCVQQPKNGWSFRLMWRDEGRIELYIYDQSRLTNGQRCGITKGSAKNVLTKNKWINIKMYMKLNTREKSDGIAKLYIDNKLIIERRNIQFRGVNNGATIDFISFNTFYGGNDPSWAPSKTTTAYYRGINLYTSDLK